MADNKSISELTAATTAALTDLAVLSVGGLARKMTLTNLKTVLGIGATPLPTLHVRDEQTANTAGGGASAATWNPRTLNTVVTNTITDASLASDRVTLPAGTYEIEATAPARVVDRHKLRLRNITDSSDTLIGQSSHTASTSNNDTGVAHLVGRFVLAATKTLELQHYTQTAAATNGLGLETNASVVEVYADVIIRKVA